MRLIDVDVVIENLKDMSERAELRCNTREDFVGVYNNILLKSQIDEILKYVSERPIIVEFDKDINKVIVKGEEYHKGLKWTSVKTTPPPSEEDVLVSCVDYSGDTPFTYTDVGWITPDYKNWIVGNQVNWNVIAWAPLPEPHKNIF